MRVLSLTRDAEDRGPFPDFDCCWARFRMWEQYGDMHRGACLLFERPQSARAIQGTWPGKRTYMGEVEYTRELSAEIFKRAVDADQVLSHEQPGGAVDDYIYANRDAFFFLKSDDFATEYEYRVVLAAGDDEYARVDYGDALVGVVLGERFPEWQRPGAKGQCARIDIKLGRMCWKNGRPHVVRVHP